jgi:decaprenyl-phosphate phosphoribosyltransferase
MNKMKNHLLLLRPHQWIKNLFIFASLFFTFAYSLDKFLTVAAGFILFSLASSSVYIINDYHDIEDDRKHPVNKFRPLAAGLVSKRSAIFIAVIFLAASLAGAMAISMTFLYIIIGYVVLNMAYTFKLKYVPVIDITIISIGFIIRVYAGSSLINVETSMWIVLVTFMLALFLALAKRREELNMSISMKNSINIASGYNIEVINAAMVLMAGVTIVAYIMYTVSPEVMSRVGSNKIYLTVIFVIIGFLRYIRIIFVNKESGNPTDVIITDRFLQLVIIAWLVSFWALHYFRV